jgi:hypothetical protein
MSIGHTGSAARHQAIRRRDAAIIAAYAFDEPIAIIAGYWNLSERMVTKIVADTAACSPDALPRRPRGRPSKTRGYEPRFLAEYRQLRRYGIDHHTAYATLSSAYHLKSA